jgi:hypothetical protein
MHWLYGRLLGLYRNLQHKLHVFLQYYMLWYLYRFLLDWMWR